LGLNADFEWPLFSFFFYYLSLWVFLFTLSSFL
jgi:hypothetical protein